MSTSQAIFSTWLRTRIAPRLPRTRLRRQWPGLPPALELAHAAPTPEVLAAVSTAIHDPVENVRRAAAHASGHLGITDSLVALLSLIGSATSDTACVAALAGARMSSRLDDADRERLVSTIRTRHADAVGHERPLLGNLLRELGAA